MRKKILLIFGFLCPVIAQGTILEAPKNEASALQSEVEEVREEKVEDKVEEEGEKEKKPKTKRVLKIVASLSAILITSAVFGFVGWKVSGGKGGIFELISTVIAGFIGLLFGDPTAAFQGAVTGGFFSSIWAKWNWKYTILAIVICIVIVALVWWCLPAGAVASTTAATTSTSTISSVASSILPTIQTAITGISIAGLKRFGRSVWNKIRGGQQLIVEGGGNEPPSFEL